MARRRLEELSILNVLFCLLVILIHVLAQPAQVLDRTGWPYAVVIVIQRLSFVAVYGFFFLSGLKLTLPREDEPKLGRYYLDRTRRLLLPYLLAAAIHFLLYACVGWFDFTLTEFLKGVVRGTISDQFYFFIALFQFVLLAPLFRFLSRRYSPVILLPAAMAITCLSPAYLDLILQLVFPDDTFNYGGLACTTYLIYYLAGCCAGQNYPRCLALLEENRSLLRVSALFWGAVYVVLSVLVLSGRLYVPYLELINALYLLNAIPALLDLAHLHTGALRGTAARLFRAVDRASYLIYLYHCLVIKVFHAFARRIVDEDLTGVHLVLRILVVYPVSIGGCILWQRLWAAVRGRIKRRRVEEPNG